MKSPEGSDLFKHDTNMNINVEKGKFKMLLAYVGNILDTISVLKPVLIKKHDKLFPY
jgi:hypothetical protein